MLYRLGLRIGRWRWWVILLWLALFAAGLPWAARAPTALSGGWGEAATESRRALHLLRQELGLAEASFSIVFRSQSFDIEDPRFPQGMEVTLAPLRELPGVSRVVTFYEGGSPDMVSPDRHLTYAVMMLDRTIDEGLELMPQARERLRPAPGMEVWLTGNLAIFADVIEVSHQDLQRAEMLAFPLVLVALLLAFGSLVAAGLPVAMGALSIVLALALSYLLAQGMDVTVFVLNIITFLGLGLAVDYSLFIVSRFREEMAAGRKATEAVGVTLATAGRAVLFSGGTVMLGLSGLLFYSYTSFRSLGVGGIAVTFLSLLVALTFLPAVLAVLGNRVNALSLRRVGRGRGRPWAALARWGRRRPYFIALPVVAFLLLLGSPVRDIKLGFGGAELLPPERQSRQGWELASRELGEGNLSPILMVAQAPEGLFHPPAINTLYDLVSRLQQHPGVSRVESIVSLDPRLGREQYLQLYSLPPSQRPPQVRQAAAALATERLTLLRLFSPYRPTSEEAQRLVRELRGMSTPGLTLMVSGISADLLDDVDVLYGAFPYIILFVMVATYGALLLLFRSVLLPLKATVLNLMSLLASYGALVFIFQQGHFRGLLGFEALGYTQAITPVIMFCLLFGLSMDYEVFLLSRMKEAYDQTGDNPQAVSLGLERTGAVITNAAVILALVAAAFATGYLLVIKSLGVGLAIAVLVDALVVRTLLVPALMFIMGRWNWWAPAWLARRLPRWGGPA